MGVKFEKDYFENYVGQGDYSKVYKKFSAVDSCIRLILRNSTIDTYIEDIAVLGAGTGEVLKDLDKKLDCALHGCEISKYAHKKIPKKYNIDRADLRTWLKKKKKEKALYDLIYTNSFMYLKEKDMPKVLDACWELTDFLYAVIPFTDEYYFKDEHRTLYKSEQWWYDIMNDHGFEPTRSPYLWKAYAEYV